VTKRKGHLAVRYRVIKTYAIFYYSNTQITGCWQFWERTRKECNFWCRRAEAQRWSSYSVILCTNKRRRRLHSDVPRCTRAYMHAICKSADNAHRRWSRRRA